MFDRSAWSVPAGFPEPYLYGHFASGSDVAMGVEATFARCLESRGMLFITITAHLVFKVHRLSRTKQLHQFLFVAASL